VALIHYIVPGGARCVGSGLLIDERRVLTADHVADGSGHWVECEHGMSAVARVLRSGMAEVDLAVLSLSEPFAGLGRLECARVDRSRVDRLGRCRAVGFPRWRRDGDQRRSAQVDGWVPTGEGLESTADSGLRAGWLTLVGDRIPGAPEILTGMLKDEPKSPWGGMSGAVVVAGDLVVGVVRSHNLAAGGQSLTVTPLTAIEQLPPELRDAFWKALGVPDPGRLPTLPEDNVRRIREYLGAARVLAEQHPYALPSQRVPNLPSVYLPQMVSIQSVKGQPDVVEPGTVKPHQSDSYEIHVTEQQFRRAIARAADESAIQIAEALQRFTIQDILKQHRGAVLVGGPGTGKSSLLRYLLHESATSFADGNSTPFVPVLVQARSIIGDKSFPYKSFPDAIARTVMADLGRLLGDADLAKTFAGEPLRDVPWLILLDGVDEILDREDRKSALQTVAYWWAKPQYRFLVTSRRLPPAEFQPLDEIGAPFFEIQRFSDDEVPGFARRWFEGLSESDASNLVHDFMSQLAQSRLMPLARNPLIATIMCVTFANDPEHILARSRATLYDEFVTLLMDKAISKLNERESLQKLLKPYGSAAQDAVDRILSKSRPLMEALADRRLVTSAKETLIDYAASLPENACPENVPVVLWRGVLEEVIRQSGVILDRDNDFVFIHYTVMEYLAACKLASKVPGWVGKWRLRVDAGRGEPLALFRVSIMYSNEIDVVGRTPKIIGRTPNILTLRGLVHARLVASLVHEGLSLPPGTVSLVRERLANFSAQRHNCIPDAIRDHVWDSEDDCVLAAKSLVLLDRDRGLLALARAATDPTVGGFNIYGYNELLDLERERWLSILADLASSSEMQGFDRVGVILYILGESRDLGLRTGEKLSLDRSVEDVFRAEVAFNLIEFDRDIGTRTLARLIADPLMERFRKECEAPLTKIDRRLCATAMAELVTKSETVLTDRADTTTRLITLDRNLALSALMEIATNREINGFARAGAAVALSKEAPAAGMQALRAVSTDEHTPGFHRVFCLEWSWRTSGERDRLLELLKLASERGLGGRWRVFAAEQLAGIDPDLGLQALANIHRDGTVPRLWRCRAWAIGAILLRYPRGLSRNTT
jgi:hypothetical protein